MDASAFTNPSGELKPLVRGGHAFIPAPLPPTGLDMARLVNPWLLIPPKQRAEVLATSAMEGTCTTMDQLVLEEAEVGASSADAIAIPGTRPQAWKAPAIIDLVRQ